jgi:hypothetical protein
VGIFDQPRIPVRLSFRREEDPASHETFTITVREARRFAVRSA